MQKLAILVGLLCIAFVATDDDIKFPQISSVQCIFSTEKKNLNCTSSLGSEACEASITDTANDYKTFAIGELKAIGGHHPVSWFRLYPRKQDNSGWWFYKSTKNSNAKLSIHNMEKNGKRDEGIVVKNNLCWARLIEIVRSSKTLEMIKAEKSTKSFLSAPFEKIKTIGILTITKK